MSVFLSGGWGKGGDEDGVEDPALLKVEGGGGKELLRGEGDAEEG